MPATLTIPAMLPHPADMLPVVLIDLGATPSAKARPVEFDPNFRTVVRGRSRSAEGYVLSLFEMDRGFEGIGAELRGIDPDPKTGKVKVRHCRYGREEFGCDCEAGSYESGGRVEAVATVNGERLPYLSHGCWHVDLLAVLVEFALLRHSEADTPAVMDPDFDPFA